MNNYDRIYLEISKESEAHGSASDLDAGLLLNLIMEIVEMEDLNRTKKVPKIHQKIQEKILLVAQNKIRKEEEQ